VRLTRPDVDGSSSSVICGSPDAVAMPPSLDGVDKGSTRPGVHGDEPAKRDHDRHGEEVSQQHGRVDRDMISGARTLLA
jgi:hypothetical protein